MIMYVRMCTSKSVIIIELVRTACIIRSYNFHLLNHKFHPTRKYIETAVSVHYSQWFGNNNDWIRIWLIGISFVYWVGNYFANRSYFFMRRGSCCIVLVLLLVSFQCRVSTGSFGLFFWLIVAHVRIFVWRVCLVHCLFASQIVCCSLVDCRCVYYHLIWFLGTPLSLVVGHFLLHAG